MQSFGETSIGSLSSLAAVSFLAIKVVRRYFNYEAPLPRPTSLLFAEEITFQ